MLTVSVFIPSNLSVSFLAPATQFRPIEERKYTLTRSNNTGLLFLSIGSEYDYSNVNPHFRDEVKAEWIPQMGEFTLFGRVHVSGGEFDENYANVRFRIFQKEIELALKSIVYGDQTFYTFFPWLLDAPIHIHFDSLYPQFNQVIYYGTPRQYLMAALKQSV